MSGKRVATSRGKKVMLFTPLSIISVLCIASGIYLLDKYSPSTVDGVTNPPIDNIENVAMKDPSLYPKDDPTEGPGSHNLPDVILSTTTPILGETLIINVENTGDFEISADTTLAFSPKFFQNGEKATALLPVSYNTKLGDYILNITVGRYNFYYKLTVSDREFKEQHLKVSESTASTTKTDTTAKEFSEKIGPLYEVYDPDKYWDGAFLQPCEGRITTEYGVKRYTNGAKTPTRHSGIDIAAPRGTFIAAANTGRVLFADFLALTGNTVVVEHGFGLKSMYYHMDSIAVKEGAMVTKGAKIGEVGTTGFSTGNHLHYTMLVGDTSTNPWTAFSHGYDY